MPPRSHPFLGTTWDLPELRREPARAQVVSPGDVLRDDPLASRSRGPRGSPACPRSAARRGTPRSPRGRGGLRRAARGVDVGAERRGSESLKCSEARRSRPTIAVEVVDHAARAGGAHVVAGRQQVAGVEADARGACRRRPARSGSRAPRTSARACRRRPPCPRGAARSVSDSASASAIGLRGAGEGLVDRPAALQRRAGVQHDAGRAERVARPQRRGEGRQRLVADLPVLRGAVEEIDGVDEHGIERSEKSPIASWNAATSSSE